MQMVVLYFSYFSSFPPFFFTLNIIKGGAGAFLEKTSIDFQLCITYSITVGTEGAGGNYENGHGQGYPGSFSRLNGGNLSFTAAGGIGGGTYGDGIAFYAFILDTTVGSGGGGGGSYIQGYLPGHCFQDCFVYMGGGGANAGGGGGGKKIDSCINYFLFSVLSENSVDSFTFFKK